MTNKDQEQLLQDASTLLMFASLVAKHELLNQHSPTSNMSSPPTVQQLPQQPQQPLPQQCINSGSSTRKSSEHKETSVVSSPPSVKFVDIINNPQSASVTHEKNKPTTQPKRTSISMLVNDTPSDIAVKVTPQPRKSSISILMNPPEPVVTPSPPAVSGNYEMKQKSVSPTSGLPKKGSFKPNHERSRSTPEATIAKLELHHQQQLQQLQNQQNQSATPSPTPAFQRGIDLRSKERNTENAVIAAAALTAAVDNPLPLKTVEQKPVLVKERAQVVPVSVVPAVSKSEEDQLTEPEEEDEEEEMVEARVVPVPVPMPVFVQMPIDMNHSQIKQEVASDSTSKPAIPSKEKYVPPPLETYQVNPDSGLIGCICGIEDDDGFTIQCDVCFRWQHCVCMGYENAEEVPEDMYKCYYCDESKWGKFDPEASRLRTMQRLDIDRREDSNQASVKTLPQQQNQQQGTKRKQLNSEKADNKKRKTEDKTSTNTNSSNSASGSPAPKFQSPRPDEMDDLPNKDNELLEDGITAESYQSVYYNLKENDYKRQAIKEFIDNIGLDFAGQFFKLPKLEQQGKHFRNVTIMSPNQFKSIKWSKINLPNYTKYLQEHNKLKKKNNFNKTTIQVKPYTDNQKQKFNGISKLALFISSNGGGSGGGSLTIPENTPIIEYLGEIDLFKNYCRDSINQYRMWGSPKPKVLKTTIPTQYSDETLDIVLDSRFVGNESRFIRKACPSSANCRIETVYVPEQNKFRFLVFTSKPITLKSENQDEELRLPWEWDVDHPILKLYANNNLEKFENLTNEEKSALITYIDNILHFVECGCSTSNNSSLCAIFKIKKATSYLMRSTRKASSLSNVNITKSKEELILPRPEKQYVSWEERLNQRNQRIQAELFSVKKKLGSDNNDGQQKVEEKEESALEEAKDGGADLGSGTMGMGANADDSKGEKKPPMLFKLPFKQQLLANLRSNVEMTTTVQQPTPVSSEDDSDPVAVEIPVPVVPELVAIIDKSIEEKLKPIIKQVEASTVTGEDVNLEVVEKVSLVSDNGDNRKHDVKLVPETAAPAKVVKKLSFADYKKMK